jgi:hypothetical protein
MERAEGNRFKEIEMKPNERFKVHRATDSFNQPRNDQPRFTAVYEMTGGATGTYQNYAVDADAFVSELQGLQPVIRLNELSVTALAGKYLFIKSKVDVSSYNERLS